jgi:hypothetical protein
MIAHPQGGDHPRIGQLIDRFVTAGSSGVFPFPSSGVMSRATSNLETVGATLEFGLTNPPSRSKTGHMDTCELARAFDPGCVAWSGRGVVDAGALWSAVDGGFRVREGGGVVVSRGRAVGGGWEGGTFSGCGGWFASVASGRAGGGAETPVLPKGRRTGGFGGGAGWWPWMIGSG